MEVLQIYVAIMLCIAQISALVTESTRKIIIDTDFNTMGDDGQVLAMAAQLHASKELELLGVTVVTGNQWLEQGVSDCLKAVERLGIETTVGVYAGAELPFLHTYPSYQLERATFGDATKFVAAYRTSKLQALVAPPDGFATFTVPQKRHAVQFIIDTIHRFPGQVSILSIGPMTNLALAIRQDPDIVPLIQQIVIMGGQFYVAGNSYIGVGETNWWFDAESARVVLRADVDRKIIPLDVTDSVKISDDVYDYIAAYEPATAVTNLFKDVEHWPYVYDTVALASLYNSSLDLDVRELFVDVSCDFDAEYGKGLAWEEDPYPHIKVESVSSVVFKIDNAQFFDLYVDLLTRSLPAIRD